VTYIHLNASITRSIAGCLRFFTLIQYFDRSAWPSNLGKASGHGQSGYVGTSGLFVIKLVWFV